MSILGHGKSQADPIRVQVDFEHILVDSDTWNIQLTELSEVEIFDKDKLKVLIEKVIVYGEDDMEIVWKVRNPFGSEVSV